MNFTREPIIETIITPRDGCRLVIRSSRHESEEEFTVDAVEVVSFGHALFFRSLEKPRPFLVPVGDYEVVEAKESRVVLKNAQFERTIKIGGGREGSLRKDEEEDTVLPVALEDEIANESGNAPSQDKQQQKRDRGGRRNRRRRPYEERDEMKQRTEEQSHTPQEFKPAQPPASREPREPKEPSKEPQAAPSFTHLIPPPTTLISQNIQKYKDQQSGSHPPQEPETRQEEERKPESDSDTNSISRLALDEAQPLTTNFSNLNGWNHFLS